MSNLFHIMLANFAVGDPGYNTVAHQLIDTTGDRKIIGLSLTADKLQSVSNYTREPRRLEFTCFMDAWLEEYLFSGNYELDNYISKYSVQLYRDGVLLFTGLIDASLLKHDVAADIVTVGCYDVIRLYSLDDDTTTWHLSSGAGEYPAVIHGTELSILQNTTGFKCTGGPGNGFLPLPSAPVYYSDIELGQLDLGSFYRTPEHDTFPLYLAADSFNAPLIGWYVAPENSYLEFVYIHKRKVYIEVSGWTYYYLQLTAHVWRFYNLTCPVKADYEYDCQTWRRRSTDPDNPDQTADFDTALSEFYTFIDDNLRFWSGAVDAQYVTAAAQSEILAQLTQGTVDFLGRTYSYSANGTSGENTLYTVSFAGNALPTYLQIGNRYEDTTDTNYHKNIDVIKAMLLLYNATIVANAGGNVMLCYKGGWDETITDIDQADIVSYSRSRGDWEKPDLDTLSPLTGDTSAYLAPVVLANLRAYYGQKWQLELSVDKLDKYDLALFAKIRVQGNIYGITELQLDFEADEYKLKAVQL